MNKNKYPNLFVGMLVGGLFTRAIWTYPSIESLLNGFGAVIVLMFAIIYNGGIEW